MHDSQCVERVLHHLASSDEASPSKMNHTDRYPPQSDIECLGHNLVGCVA